MAIEFNYYGTQWRADTAAEAIALRDRVVRTYCIFEDMREQAAFWTADKFFDVVNGVKHMERQLLLIIDKKPMITSKELVRELGVVSEVELADIVSRLAKQVKEWGIELKQLLVIFVEGTGKAKTRRFLLADFFQGVAEDHNWPDAWKQRYQEQERQMSSAPKRSRKR